MKWDGSELTRAIAEVARGRTYAQVARTLNADFHKRRTVRTAKSVELKLTRSNASAETVRETGGDAPVPAAAPEPPAPPGDKLEVEDEGSVRTIVSQSTTIRTVDELLAHLQVDTTEWRIERQKLTKWDIGAKGPDGRIVTAPLFGVKVSMVPKLSANYAEERDALLDEVANQAPVAYVRMRSSSKVAAEFALADLHLGKYAWAEETGEDYDLETAVNEASSAMMHLLERAGRFNPERALLVLGNDAFHIDNRMNTTTAGTLMDADTRYWRILRRGRQLFSGMVRRLAHDVGPIDVAIVPGNHDEQTTLVLGELLYVEFENNPYINIDHSLYPRKYWEYGTTLLGFTHGNDEKHADLPLLMANEQPDAWARTSHREWHTGHFHKIKETRFTAADSFGGVRVRTLPALSGTDAWHAKKGYVGELRSAEAYLWAESDGYLGHVAYTHRVDKTLPLLNLTST